VRVVKSQSDRAFDTIRDRVDKIKTHRKTNNWSAIQDEFDEVNRLVDRSKVLILKNGIPKFYIKMLAEIEDLVNATVKDKEGMRKMKQTTVHAVNRMKLNVRKHNKNYEKEIADYRAHPENYEEEEEEASDDEEDDDEDEESEEEEEDDEEDDEDSEDVPPLEDLKRPKKITPKKSSGESDSEDSLFQDDDDDSSESEEEATELKGRARWLKKAPTVGKAKPKATTERTKGSSANRTVKVKNYDGDTKKKAVWHLNDEMKEEELDKKISELIISRGRKNTDPRELLRKLEMLSKASRKFGIVKEIPILMHLISAMYDAHRSIDDYMDLQRWRTCYRCLMRIVQLLDSNRSIVLGCIPSEDVTDMLLQPLIKVKRSDGNESEIPEDKNRSVLKVVGSLDTFLVRLEDEYTKSLQQINPHTQVLDIIMCDLTLE
jgi:translation initiation factor 3 subunit C